MGNLSATFFVREMLEGFWLLRVEVATGAYNRSNPKGPKTGIHSRSPSGIENFQARLTITSEVPPRPYFLEGILEVKTEFKRSCNFQAKMKISSEIEVFQCLGP